MKAILKSFFKNRKYLVVLISVSAILVLAVIIGWILFQKEKVPSEIIKEETIEDILKRLTPEDSKPLTEQEQKELDELLKQLTPSQPKPMTEKEQKELEELLKQLTPQ